MEREIKALHVGSAPLIGALCDAMKIVEMVNNLVNWDEKQWKLSPGLLIKAMLINILSGRTAFYRYESFFENLDTELIFGRGVHASDFKDDALASALDRIYAYGPRKLFSRIAMNGLLLEDVDLEILHGDTTTKVLYGEYSEEGPMIPLRGHSKDKRPDLKQIVIGLTTSKDGGVPVNGNVNSGNKDDKTWNNDNIEQLVELLTEEMLEKLIYVTDSACVNETFLGDLGEKGLQFISLMPRTFNLREKLVDMAWRSKQWQEIGRLAKNPKGAFYKVWATRDKLNGREYRFVVVHSDQLDKKKLRGLNTRLKKQRKELEKACQEAMKREYACEEDAQIALKKFLKKNQSSFYPVESSIKKETVRERRNKPGRPKADEKQEYKDIYRLCLKIGSLDQEVFKKAKDRLSCFVLISNVEDPKFTASRLLEEYKSQSQIENKFKFIKDPLMVGPLLLEKNHRIDALGYVILLALFVYSILERRVRKALEDEEEPIVLQGKVKSFRPTGRRIIELFSGIIVVLEYNHAEGGSVKRYIDKRFNRLNRVAGLAGFDMSIYTSPP